MTKMTFKYSAAPQKSPEWYKIRVGKPTASRLEDWLAVSKAEKTKGKPLKARLDYERELRFEQRFSTTFDRFVTKAMDDGVEFEKHAANAYSSLTGLIVEECGCWYNDHFVASPDRVVAESVNGNIEKLQIEDFSGLLEIKVVKDNTFTDILTSGAPDKWWKQIQGQLWSSGKAWCDFVALNLHTKKVKIIRVLPDKEFHEWLELALTEELVVPEIEAEGVHDVSKLLPEISDAKFDKINQDTGGVTW